MHQVDGGIWIAYLLPTQAYVDGTRSSVEDKTTSRIIVFIISRYEYMSSTPH